MSVTVREHGIYETRGGEFVAAQAENGYYRLSKPSFSWRADFSGHAIDLTDDYELIREVVVGPGWMPWNGGEKAPVEGRVEYVLRDGSVCRHAPHSSVLRWTWGDGCGPNNDIVAYRVLKPVETSAPIIKVSAADIDDPSALLAKVSTLAADAEKWRKLLAFMREMEAP